MTQASAGRVRMLQNADVGRVHMVVRAVRGRAWRTVPIGLTCQFRRPLLVSDEQAIAK